MSRRTQDVFVYCGQLNALEAFCWIEWCIFIRQGALGSDIILGY